MASSDFQNYLGVFRAQAPGERRKVAKRNRQPVSCIPCRQKKLKCDRQQPCGACSKRGDASVCEFGTCPTTPTARPKEKARSEAQIRLQKLEEMVNGLIQSRSQGPSDSSPESSSSAEVHERMQSLDMSGVSKESRDSAGYYLSSRDTEVSFVGATHWIAILEGIHDLKGYLESETRPNLEDDDEAASHALSIGAYTPPTTFAAPLSKGASKHDLILGPYEPLTLRTALEGLPDRKTVDNILALYFTSRFFAVPFLHPHKFQRDYNAFMKNPEKTSFMFISILFSVLSIASGIIVASGKGDIWPAEAIDSLKYMSFAGRAIITGEYLKAQPLVIEAMLLHTHSKFLRTIDSEPTLWSIVGLTVRLAQKMGLHRDDARLSKQITPFQAEMRRRMWFHVETFDLLMSFQLGMPPIINGNECDIGHPLNILPSDFDEDTKELPPERSDAEDSPMLFFAYKSRFIRLYRKVIRHALNTQQPAYAETMEIDAELRALHEGMPLRLRIQPINEAPFSDTTPAIMKRLMLEMLYLKGLLILHRNFLTCRKSDPTFAFSRETASDAAIRMLELHDEYHRETSPGGRIYEERWMLSSLTLHDFLMSAMVVCLDLSEQPQKSREVRDTKVKALRTSFRIWQERRSISRDADHAANVISAMLAKLSAQEPEGVVDRQINPVDAPAAAALPKAPKERISPAAVSASSVNSVPPLQSDESPAFTDSSFEFMDLDSFDEILANTDNLDWNAVDQYLRDYNQEPLQDQLHYDALEGGM